MRKFAKIPDLSVSDVDRLLSGIQKKNADECWPWLRGTANGYGCIGLGSRKTHRQVYVVTRVLWKFWYHEDPGELFVCHECNNPPCCNPDHLFLGDNSVNMQHAFDSGRLSRAGQFNSCVKLTSDLADIIREEIGSMSDAAIGRKYGIGKSHVGRIKRGEVWCD